jgi:hypothetical protein
LSDDPDKKHHHDNPSSGSPCYGNLSSGNSESNTSQIASGKFQKQYIAGKDLRINIVQEDITKMTVDNYHSKGYQRKGCHGDVFYQDHPTMTLTNYLFHLSTM